MKDAVEALDERARHRKGNPRKNRDLSEFAKLRRFELLVAQTGEGIVEEETAIDDDESDRDHRGDPSEPDERGAGRAPLERPKARPDHGDDEDDGKVRRGVFRDRREADRSTRRGGARDRGPLEPPGERAKREHETERAEDVGRDEARMRDQIRIEGAQGQRDETPAPPEEPVRPGRDRESEQDAPEKTRKPRERPVAGP